MTKTYLIVDAHEDLASNMVVGGRDYSRSVTEMRQIEKASKAENQSEETVLGWPEYQMGKVAVVFGTLFAAPRQNKPTPWDRFAYSNPEEAHKLYWEQLECYHRFTDNHPDQFRLIETNNHLNEVMTGWKSAIDAEAATGEKATSPVGIVILMEGAEGVHTPDELDEWQNQGVRIIGLAWKGTRFCGGTGQPGPMTREGWELLKGMEACNLTLDISHMDEAAAVQVLDKYPGRIIASHANARALLKGTESNRHLRDEVITKLVERQGLMGLVISNPFLSATWTPEDGKQAVTLQKVVEQIDYICQLVGDARHVGMGSDFDGGFGLLSTPAEIGSIADMQQLPILLAQKGYSEEDIAAIMGKNWLKFLEETLP